MEYNFDIDIVIPWVDGNDIVWLNEKRKYDNQCLNQPSRYRDYGLMRYWFRAVEKNMNWFHKIFFVTFGHLPVWLDIDNPRLVVVNHKDFIPHEYLPTFNSSVIEMNIHRIKGLAEHFIYMNDDIFMISKIDKKFYFSKSGLPKQMLVMEYLWNYNVDSDYCYKDFNNVGIINRHFSTKGLKKKNIFNLKYGIISNIKNIGLLISKIYPGFKQAHMSVAFLKSSFENIWDIEGEYLDNVCHHKFRHYKDVNQWLIQYWQLVNGIFSPANKMKKQKLFVLGENSELLINAINNETYKEICINDNDTKENIDEEIEMLLEAFQKKYPDKSGFEK
ncbi:MAG: Stealth CR1 domain-containing protein [Clostridiales bacterium]|nr:Stealth CR1 domain-containing protein [Clostridiales bacterium]